MRNNLNKKGEEAINWVVVLIVALLVLVSIMLFIYRADILEKFRGVSGYKYNPKDVVVDISKDALAKIKFCPVLVGKLITPSDLTFFEWIRIHIDSSPTELLFYIGSSKIQLDESWDNEEVGIVDANGRVDIYDRWYTDFTLRAEHDTIPSVEDLKRLDGAYLFGNNICKEEAK